MVKKFITTVTTAFLALISPVSAHPGHPGHEDWPFEDFEWGVVGATGLLILVGMSIFRLTRR